MRGFNSLRPAAGATCLPNGSAVDDEGTGVLANHGGNEVLLRSQFQLVL